MIPYQMTSMVIGLAIAGLILYLIHRGRLYGVYALWWLGVALVVVILGFAPELVDWLAALLGVNYPPLLAVILGIGAILVKMLTMDLHRSQQELKIRRLAQRLALLETAPHDRPDDAVDLSVTGSPGVGERNRSR